MKKYKVVFKSKSTGKVICSRYYKSMLRMAYALHARMVEVVSNDVMFNIYNYVDSSLISPDRAGKEWNVFSEEQWTYFKTIYLNPILDKYYNEEDLK